MLGVSVSSGQPLPPQFHGLQGAFFAAFFSLSGVKMAILNEQASPPPLEPPFFSSWLLPTGLAARRAPTPPGYLLRFRRGRDTLSLPHRSLSLFESVLWE